jgi:hypothetical protein
MNTSVIRLPRVCDASEYPAAPNYRGTTHDETRLTIRLVMMDAIVDGSAGSLRPILLPEKK